jgi:hypothetical protein
MPRKLKDPVFGTLEFDDIFWVGMLLRSSFGRNVRLCVDGGIDPERPEPPSNAQRREFESFVRKQEVLRHRAQEQLLAYYRKVRAVVLEQGFLEENESPS